MNDFERQQIMMGAEVLRVGGRETGSDPTPEVRSSHRTEPRVDPGSAPTGAHDNDIPLPEDVAKSFESIFSEDDLLERASGAVLLVTVGAMVATGIGISFCLMRALWKAGK